jgi:hypothetical protein
MDRSRALIAVAALAGGTFGTAAEPLAYGPRVAAVPRPTLSRVAPPSPRVGPHGPRFTIARVRGHSVPLRAAPGAPVVARARPRTQFGSPTALAVAARHGRWLGVKSSAMPNARLAWVDGRSRAIARRHTRVSLHIDLRRLLLTLRDGKRVVERARVGAGSPSSPTPTGRFAVTDKLPGGRFSRSYGCCVLALSGRQPHPPRGWRGGDRLAIHGTDSPGTIAARASAGCLHARDKDLKPLMRRVPLGTPVFIAK